MEATNLREQDEATKVNCRQQTERQANLKNMDDASEENKEERVLLALRLRRSMRLRDRNHDCGTMMISPLFIGA